MHTILLVEDDPSMQSNICQYLARDSIRVVSASSLAEADSRLSEFNCDLVLLDIHLPDGDGRDLFTKIRQETPELPVIMLTAFPDTKGAIRLMKDGAFDYLIKPFDLQELKLQVQKALEFQGMRNEIQKIQYNAQLTNQTSDLIGNSPVITELKTLVHKVGPTDSTVLICGESGTGKELVAHAIHRHSLRSASSLVAINCAAIPENLLEAELFGAETGAYTGATSSRKGVFELAHKGTLFLDEIAEMPLALQPKLLRVLENLKIKRLGGKREIQVDVRLIAATNRDLKLLVADHAFREDLYYRLNVIPLNVPPLREREGDVAVLVPFFLQTVARQLGVTSQGITSQALEILQHQRWAGNVRELKNLVERMAILSRVGNRIPELTVQDLPAELRGAMSSGWDLHESDRGAEITNSMTKGATENVQIVSLEDLEKDYILKVLDLLQGNKSETARRLGITRKTLKDKLRRYELDSPLLGVSQ